MFLVLQLKYKSDNFPPLFKKHWGVAYKLKLECDATTLLVNLAFHNKIPQMGWLKQQMLVSSKFWRLEVQDQDSSSVCF